MKKYIIFDFNGTLINDVELGLKLINEFLTYQNKPILDMDRYRHIFGFPIRDYYIRAGLDLNADDFNHLAEIYNIRYMRESLSCKLYPEVVDLLTYLYNNGYYLICLSSSEINNLIFQLKYYKIHSFFSTVIGTSTIHGNSKKELGYNFIVDNNIDPSDVLVIGDTLHDVEVAELIGCDYLLYNKGHQHEDFFDKDKTISNLEEIKKYI